MKIAFPANGKVISDHFGHCANFKIFEMGDNKSIINQSTIEAPSVHQPGVLPKILQEQGVDVVIVGGIGQKAIELFNESDIKVVTGVSGLIEKALENFLNGTLQNGENICSH
jgi:predicted Fe-Mo cluster-binding NifX family protein